MATVVGFVNSFGGVWGCIGIHPGGGGREG